MSQIYKVFSNNWIFYLKEDSDITYNMHCCKTSSNIESFIELMKLSVSNQFSKNLEKKKVCFLSKRINDDWLKIVKSFRMIEAAGGLVKKTNNDLLFILKNGKWDLPKGKVEYGESPKKAAVREIREETGITDIELINLISETYHLYKEKDIILKKTFWFSIKKIHNQEVTPQKEEGITAVKWFSKEKIPNTYNSIWDVINKI